MTKKIIMITQHTTLNIVIGHPLDHTQSPLLHNTLYQALNLNTVFLATPYPNLPSLIQAIKTFNIGLTAITMPFKEAAIKHVDHCAEDATQLGAINTIIQKNGELWGYNTDIHGIEHALRHTLLRNKNALIIGAGGAARALAYVLKKYHANLFWLNRTQEKALSLIKAFGGQPIDQSDISKMDLLINTTPLGMHPHIDASPLPDEIFHPHQTVFDMIYNPLETKLLTQANVAGAKTISGMEMFIGQGIQQVSLWQGRDIYTPEIEAVARKALSLG